MLPVSIRPILVAGALSISHPALAQMYCAESVSDTDYKLEVSVCVTDSKRDLILHVRNLDTRRKEITLRDCSVDLRSIGGPKYRTGRARLLVYESRPNNRHVIAPALSANLASGFRTLDTKYIQCMYVVKVLEQQAESSGAP